MNFVGHAYGREKGDPNPAHATVDTDVVLEERE